MRLLLFFPLCLILSANSTLAQSKRFAVRAGANYSLMNFNKGVPTPPTAVPNTWKPGYEVSFQLRVPLVDIFSLMPEYGYAKANGRDKRINANYSFDYLTLPVLLQAELTPWLRLNAGPKFDLLIHSKQTLNGVVSNITHDTEERNISALFGTEINVAGPLSIDLRYVHGFNHVGLGQRSSLTEFKWRSFSLAAKLAF
jgi:hypothetical protein